METDKNNQIIFLRYKRLFNLTPMERGLRIPKPYWESLYPLGNQNYPGITIFIIFSMHKTFQLHMDKMPNLMDKMVEYTSTGQTAWISNSSDLEKGFKVTSKFQYLYMGNHLI